MILNRREFVGVVGATIAVVGVGTFGFASAGTAASLSSSTPVFAEGIERRSRSIGGVWRTYAWHHPASSSSLEIIGERVRLNSGVFDQRRFEFREFALGEPQRQIRERVSDSVLQEVLEEIERGNCV